MKGLEIEDITWPANSPTAPKGRPSMFKLKVVTIEEKPFVIYRNPDDKYKNFCPSQSASIRIKPMAEVNK